MDGLHWCYGGSNLNISSLLFCEVGKCLSGNKWCARAIKQSIRLFLYGDSAPCTH